MGAVYKARDKELDRVVALKLIRPELARNPEVLRRFKQELILARQVTHKNVIRIFDLGQSDGIKFITMDFVEGQDLRQLLLERGKFPAEQAAQIMLQICRALEAAHNEHVIHRDLKPQNIMLDSGGRVYVMDFGIARSAHLPGMTQTGALIGTPEYMSPEQARGENLTERSDLFSLGVILYELLTAKSPYPADAPLATLWKRLQEKPKPPVDVDPTVPKPLSDIVMKALELEPENRFASAREMAQQLEIWLGPSAGSTTIFLPAPHHTHYWKWASATLAVLLVAAVVAFRLKGPAKPIAAHTPVSVLVADFANTTGDTVFDETLEPPLSVALEDASFISSFSRNQAKKIASQLQPGGTSLEETTARLVGVREGIGYIVSGLIEKKGSGFEVHARTLETATGKILLEVNESADDKKGVLGVVGKIAAHTRRVLGDTTPEAAQITAAETYTTGSLEAAHEYALAQDVQWQGKWEEAIQHYDKAVQLDSEMGRAYAGAAVASYNLGRMQDAHKDYDLALSKIARMSDREKYRTRGGYYMVMNEPRKAIDQYSLLVKQYPSDSAGRSNLALAYENSYDMAHALEEGRKAVEMNPHGVPQRSNLGLYAMYSGDFDTAIQQQQEVLKLNPSFVRSYLGMALSQLAKGQLAAAAETYHNLEKVGPQGASPAAAGLADLALYEGRASDAISILEKAAAADLENKDSDNAANKLTTLAYAHVLLNHSGPALTAADKAVATSKETNVLFWAARVYLALEKESKALALAHQLETLLGPDPRAYAKLIESEIQIKHAKGREALPGLQEAQKLTDSWMIHFDLARAYVDAGAFAEADSELELCMKRRGEATSLFLDEVPTYHVFPEVHYYVGRAQEGLKSAGAPEAYKTFLAIKEKGGQDPLVTDARRRLANH
jgi:serine/threonine protein kinase/tetratricopeptide (TPR) repeat protein